MGDTVFVVLKKPLFNFSPDSPQDYERVNLEYAAESAYQLNIKK